MAKKERSRIYVREEGGRITLEGGREGIYIYIYIYIYRHTHIEREREREREKHIVTNMIITMDQRAVIAL